MSLSLDTSELGRLAAFLSLLAIAYGAFFATRLYIRRASSPIQDLLGPESASWVSGSFPGGLDEYGTTRLHEQWVQKYGRVFRYYANFGVPKLMVADARAVGHILSHGTTFEKWDAQLERIRAVLGNGLASVEGPDHRRQRKVINPAFGPVQVRKFTQTFLEKSLELRDIWLSKTSQPLRKDGKVQVDAFNWLNKVTLDIIGLTGFNYSFNALRLPDGQKDELYEAISTAGSVESGSPVFRTLQLIFPPARLIPTTYTRNAKRGLKVIDRICNHLVAGKKAAVLNEAGGKQAIEKDDIEGHDVLSLLIKANMAADMPDSMRMTDAEVLAQIPTLLGAGHETTSTAVSWTLFALSTHASVQTKLRDELSNVTADTPSMDELNSLKYLDYVVHEALRLYAPVPMTHRAATQPDVIPVGEPFVDARGKTQHSIRVNAGDVINIPIRALNRSIEIWGEDAHEFKPERWEKFPETVQTMPGVFSHILTFLGGPHACIGFRFSVVETKALLFTLVRAFEFELAVSPDDIVRRTMFVGRPWVDGIRTGPQLPVLIRPTQKA